jgi:hypothetical protein
VPRFSEQFGIRLQAADDWFDPTLERDTSLFVDPFLISDDPDPFWSASYADLITFFNTVLILIADSGGRHGSQSWRRASALLTFHEPAEFALGYGVDTIFGSGTGAKIRDDIMTVARQAIALGLDQVSNLEELMLLGQAIGPDRIGDLVCNVLKSSFIRYTQDVVSRHGLPTHSLPVKNADWSRDEFRWIDRYVDLPRNGVYPRTPVLLTPSRFLRELPTVDADSFWEWAWLNYEDDLKQQFNYHIAQRVDRREIIRLARSRQNIWRAYVQSRDRRPYDLHRDSRDHVTTYNGSHQLAALIRAEVPQDSAGFCAFVKSLLNDFRWTIEEKRGWEILWTDTGPRSERVAQVLFSQTLTLVCRAANIDLSREVETGRGPVDFKFSAGWSARTLVELKLAHSSSLKSNVRFQMPQYLKSEDVPCGYLVVIQFDDNEVSEEKVNWITSECARISAESGKLYEPIFVDARQNPPSASTQR